MNCFYIDSVRGSRCLQYVRNNIAHFRVVDDGWKGEENFMEPYKFWDSVAHQLYPNSSEANEISFDIDFKDMIRKYSIDTSAFGKTCEQYCKDVFQGDSTYYLKYYTREEISKWPQECAERRARFESEKTKLLEKYGDEPFTKVLRYIDPTMIVIYYTVC